MRQTVLEELEECIESLNHPYIIVGDFNQVEFGVDKQSKSTRTIQGAYEFSLWRIKNELVDIPFKGPRFTWCNNRKGDKRVYERIDRAMGSKDLLSIFPNTGIKHYPIQISDHAPFELDLHLTQNTNKKPYKIDAWVMEDEECMGIIRASWLTTVVGTAAYRVARKSAITRQNVKRWALDKRQRWNKKWDDFD
ncbi:uncharacterized protein LOC141595550 [Silene latifolia]|uniref:uncharacterized protein LOC141595550 n=1 Tax=Silene latifolia TaxID=37657 RepID=UPI003D76D66A